MMLVYLARLTVDTA